MKTLLSTALLTALCTVALGQVYQVKLGHCKKKNIEIITGETIPTGHVIMQMSTLERAQVAGTVEGLTKKQISTMKQYAKWKHACKVFVAFKPLQTFEGYTPGADYYEDKVCFYVLAPAWEVKMK